MKRRHTTSLLLLAIIALWSIAMLSACGSDHAPYDTSPTPYDLTVTVIEKHYAAPYHGSRESFILLVRVVSTPNDLRPFTVSVPITTYVKAEVGKVMELPGHP